MSTLELAELRQILDDAETRKSGERTTEEMLHSALQALFMHQCIYADEPLSGMPYDIICRHRTFVEKYAAAMGFELLIERRDGLAALRSRGPIYGWKQNRLKKDETLVFLALRYLLEEGTRRGDLSEQGRVDSSTDELFDVIKTLARTEPPGETRLEEILRFARRKGLVRIGERDRYEQITPLTILPGIRIIVPDVTVEAVIDWIEKGAVDAEANFFDRIADSSAEGSDVVAEDSDDGMAESEQAIDPIGGADGKVGEE